MTGQYFSVGRKGENLVLDAFQFLTVISSREVGTPNAHAEECVAGDNDTRLWDVVAHSARCVARCVQYLYGIVAEIQGMGFTDAGVNLWQHVGNVHMEPLLYHIRSTFVDGDICGVAHWGETVAGSNLSETKAVVEMHMRLQGIFSKSDRFLCVRLKPQQADTPALMDHALHSDLFQTFSGSYILFTGREQCLLLNLTRQPIAIPQVRHRLAPLCRDYCLYAGISSPVNDISELHIAYHQAEIALNRAFQLRSEKWIIPFQDCVLEHLASHLESPLLPAHLVSPELLQLKEYDDTNGTQFFETLKTYLLLERDIPKTAQALIVHRTTLLYRLKKIQQLVNLNLEDPDHRLYLLFSLWLLNRKQAEP